MIQKASAHPPLLFQGTAVRQLLVPVVADHRPDRGVDAALQLAQAWGTPVVLLHVGAIELTEDDTASPVVEMATELRRRHPDLDIETTAFDHRDVAAAIINSSTPDTLTVLATDHARQWLGEGSVAERLVQRGAAPILLVGPRATGRGIHGEVLVALDGTPLAEDGVAAGLALAAAADAPMRIVTVIPTATLEHIEHLKEQGQRVSESAYLRAMADQLGEAEVPVAWEIVHDDDAIGGLVDLAARRDTSMIVATTHAGTGVLRQRFGSTSMGLVEHATVPVLIVHPTGGA